jgi:hypothetical protein
MTSDDAVLIVIDALEKQAVPYMVVGSFSSNFYGVPRSTLDADFVIQFNPDTFSAILGSLGAAFRLDPQLSFESITMTTRHVLEVVGSAFKIELFHLSEEPYDQERFRRRRRVKMLDREVSLPTVEDVVVTKLRWAQGARRSKDQDDVRAVIILQGKSIDWTYVYKWCDQHGTRALLDDIRRSLPTPRSSTGDAKK